MQALYGMLTEQELLRLCIRDNEIYKDIDLLEEIVNSCYNGSYCEMLFKLVQSELTTYSPLSTLMQEDPNVWFHDKRLVFLKKLTERLKPISREEAIIVRYNGYSTSDYLELGNAELKKLCFCIGERDDDVMLMQIYYIIHRFMNLVNNWMYSSVTWDHEYFYVYVVKKHGAIELVLT